MYKFARSAPFSLRTITSHPTHNLLTHTFRRPTPPAQTQTYVYAMSGQQQLKGMHHFSHISMTAEESPDFRRVLWTGKHSQLVIMDIPVGGEIGEEVHHVDQTLCFTKGKAKAIIEGEEKEINAGDVVIVPAGNRHNFINIGSTSLLLYTVYAPAEHADKAVHHTKEQGDKLEDEGKDEPPKWAQEK